ncbi:uncharacterized protein LTR77_007781 [Saxophila tyrrhenica]|uniref:Uncharacterized protein n=1 Tax=Saxophila tyrrhenica TaxID=1690608 RepID=A0AAV9P6D3_9PEZI|nr:hypothetical protein LTR77_007781 [Saxophila tyrrhenica]
MASSKLSSTPLTRGGQSGIQTTSKQAGNSTMATIPGVGQKWNRRDPETGGYTEETREEAYRRNKARKESDEAEAERRRKEAKRAAEKEAEAQRRKQDALDQATSCSPLKRTK